MLYNLLARYTAGCRALIADAAAAVLRLLSRDLEPQRRAVAAACAGGGVAAMAMRVHHGDDDLDEAHEINVTPFIDVMLVLLIIFMVAAPLATVDVAVDLPVSTAEPQPREPKPIFLTLKADHTWRSAKRRWPTAS